MNQSNENQFICKVILELKPKSRQIFSRLLFRRENSKVKLNEFDLNKLEEDFFNQYENQPITQGIYIQLDRWILFVVDVQYHQRRTEKSRTIIEFLYKGLFLKFTIFSKHLSNNRFNNNQLENFTSENQKILNSPLKLNCCQCEKELGENDLFTKTTNSNKPIVCLLCFQSEYHYQCHRCQQSILFQDEIYSDETNSFLINFVKFNGFYWHSTCSKCLICSKSLIGKEFYQDPIYNHLFCVQHIPD